jgi:hypothetical protein
MATPDPLRVHPVDLAAGPPTAGPREDGNGLYLSVWWRHVPLGVDELNDRGLPPRALADLVDARTFVQSVTLTVRLDYLSPVTMNWSYALAVE